MPERIGSNKNLDESVHFWVENCPSAQEIFSRAKKSVEDLTGLELTNIELVKLKEIASTVEKILKEQRPNVGDGFAPVQETIARFLFECYGIDSPVTQWAELGIKKRGAKDVKQWFKDKQGEQHFP